MPVSRLRRKLTLTTVFGTAAVAGVLLLLIGAALWWFWPEPKYVPFQYASTVAGTGKEFGEPFGIAVKGKEIYVSDGQNDKIWRIDSKGVSVFAEGLDTPSGIAFLPNGDMIVAETGANRITTLKRPSVSKNPDEDHGLSLMPFNGPIGIAVVNQSIFVADTYSDSIKLITERGSSGFAGSERGFADGVGVDARFDTPTGIAAWGDKLLVADTGNHRIRVIESDGRVSTLAGTGESDLRDGPVAEAAFVQPTALAVHPDGTIFVADGNAIREISGEVTKTVKTVSSDRRGLNDGDVGDARFNRPSTLALDANGDLIVADSENRLVRRLSATDRGAPITIEQIAAMRDTAEAFRSAAAPGRWPYDPPERPRDIAGTLGELRGEVVPGSDQLWFHNGLDMAGGYGETARFIRDEKVLRPIAAENFNTLRELLRMPTLGYIHLRLGRDAASKPFGDQRFQFERDALGNLTGVRVPRGTKFKAGEAIGTLNSMNHVHLIAGRSGSELNALDALDLPGVADTRPPVIEDVKLYDENWAEIETPKANSRIRLSGKTRIVVRAYDQMDGNSDRRRLGVYRVSWGIRRESPVEHAMMAETKFDRMPSNDLVAYAYAEGSRSGATGETIFRYIATNSVNGDRAEEGFLDASTLEPGSYTVAVIVADRFGNTAERELLIEVVK